MNTVVLDGHVFVLVPEQAYELIQETLTAVAADKGLVEPGFPEVSERSVPDPYTATPQEKIDSIKIVDPTTQLDVPEANPKPYEYRERFVRKELTPADVTTVTRISPVDLRNNPEDPMIRADNARPEGKRLFYGPGVEADYGY